MGMSHETCDHPRTPAGRAWCRKNGGPASGAVWGKESAPAPVKPIARIVSGDDTRPAVHPMKFKHSMADLPGVFRTAVTWAENNSCLVTMSSPRSQRCVHLTNELGTLTLTWSPSTPDGVHAVSFRSGDTSVATRLGTVNEGLVMLRGE